MSAARRPLAAALVAALALAAAGCSRTRACKPGTLFVDVTLDAGSAAADTLAVTLALPGRTLHASSAHSAGVLHGSLQLGFADAYPAGQSGTLTVVATREGVALGQGTSGPAPLAASCSNLTVEVRATNAGTGDMATADMATTDMAPPPAQPRLIAPLSTATVTSQRPTLRWVLGAGGGSAVVDLCKDRACSVPIGVAVTVAASGTRGTPDAALPAGVVFWRVRVQSGGATQTSATWQLVVGARTASTVDSSWGATLDLNGDGYADLVAAAPTTTVGTTQNVGRVHVYYGSPAGLKVGAADAVTLEAPAEGSAQFGAAVAAAGDIDGDGFADLVVGAPGAGSGGRIHVYRGSAAGLVTTGPQSIDAPDGGGFGSAVSAAGDVNGDGYGDIVVGAPAVGGQTGRAYVFLGGAGGLAATPVVLTAPDAGGRFGHAVTGGGDFDGDGFGDLVVGADLLTVGSNPSSGRAYLYSGSAAGPGAPTAIDPPDGGGNFGSAVAVAGDVNGDGYSDFVIGAPLGVVGGVEAGRAHVVLGNNLTGAPRTATLQSLDAIDTTAANYFGAAVASAHDVNGDGYDDIVVGSPFVSPSQQANGAGAAYVFYGSANGVARTARTDIASPDGFNAQLGTAVAGLGDTDGDGFGEVAVGAASASFAGRVHVYRGSSNGPLLGSDGAGTAIDSTDNGEFGLALQ